MSTINRNTGTHLPVSSGQASTGPAQSHNVTVRQQTAPYIQSCLCRCSAWLASVRHSGHVMDLHADRAIPCRRRKRR
jgi:hypothetical protein